MGRRWDDGILDALLALLQAAPLWLGPVMAVIVWLAVSFAVPAILSAAFGGAAYLESLRTIARMVGPVLAGLVVLCWAVAIVKRGQARRLVDRNRTLEAIRGLSWADFERYVAEAYRRQGYHVELCGHPAGDGGVDVVLRRDGTTTLVQCKHWKSRKTGVKTVRELLGVMTSRQADGGIVICSGGFTEHASVFAEANRIQLVDGDGLVELVNGVLVEKPMQASEVPAAAAGQTASVAPTQAPPACPRCGGPMVRRTARRGSNAGKEFWGCQAYPKCRGTLPGN